ncbi:MAG: hypothetical protein HC937_03470 [Aquincola sp.]|nr:hypothetical protein [Aquincola sp.]
MKRIAFSCALVGALAQTGCGGEKPRASGTAGDLLTIGYDREPDTMNRYATHILEDIESCVVEGLVVNDETMRIIPVLALEVPTTEMAGSPAA